LSRIHRAYSERVHRLKTTATLQSETEATLNSLGVVCVGSDDPEEAKRYSAALSDFLERPCNKRCADCGAALTAPTDTWASINLGVLVCVRCAGLHRSLGISTSRIKSLVYDTWDVAMAEAILQRGNDVGRETYLPHFSSGAAMPNERTDDQRLLAHVRNKYVRLRWAEPELRAARQVQQAAHLARAKRAGGHNGQMPSLSSDALTK